MDKDQIKTALNATLARLNSGGQVVASWYDADIALRRAVETKVAEGFRAIFTDMTLEQLADARLVVDQATKAVFESETASATPPPASQALAPFPTKKGKRK